MSSSYDADVFAPSEAEGLSTGAARRRLVDLHADPGPARHRAVDR